MGLRSRLFALTYNRLMASGEKAGLAGIRATLLAGASGDVLEVGAGTGLNLTHYAGEVSTLTVTEPDASMLRRLERVAGPAPSTTILRAPAEDLPFEDATFDTVVSTLVLCGVDDQPRAVREIRRVPQARWTLALRRARPIRRRCRRPPPGPDQLAEPASGRMRLQPSDARDPATRRVRHRRCRPRRAPQVAVLRTPDDRRLRHPPDRRADPRFLTDQAEQGELP